MIVILIIKVPNKVYPKRGFKSQLSLIETLVRDLSGNVKVDNNFHLSGEHPQRELEYFVEVSINATEKEKRIYGYLFPLFARVNGFEIKG